MAGVPVPHPRHAEVEVRVTTVMGNTNVYFDLASRALEDTIAENLNGNIGLFSAGATPNGSVVCERYFAPVVEVGCPRCSVTATAEEVFRSVSCTLEHLNLN